MPPALLFTQCLQADFVAPIGRFEPLPNRLHVGHAEARRLMGENPREGPVARVMRWAHEQPDERLRLVHLRDWHDPADPAVQSHFALFGRHCVRDTPGARFAFSSSDGDGKRAAVVDSATLNDFHGTELEAVLAPLAAERCRVGIVGVWTEAKVSFLAYELVTRYPAFEVAACSALTASSSRQHHFQALERLERLLGVRVIDSVGDFMEFLGGRCEADLPLVGLPERRPVVESCGLELDEVDRTLVRYLFRDCRSVRLRELTGGFSGNVVAGSASVDLHGHEQVPHVVKIGPREPIGRERSAFERIQDVLGNSAPQVTDFADLHDRGAIKYRYASMGGSFSTTFQKAYQDGMEAAQVREVIDTVFGEQLGRLYRAAEPESCDLLEEYAFSDRWAGSVRRKVEAIVGESPVGDVLEVLPGRPVPNVCTFYEETLKDLPRRPADQVHQAWLHGDLNGANIVLDGNHNVWLIDFFHAHRGHVLKDLVKLENDLLYIWTPVEDAGDLEQAVELTDKLLAVSDLGALLPEAPPAWRTPFRRAWETIRQLRSHHPSLVRSDREPFQLRVAQLRYSVHTLSFDESSPLQRRWALHASCLLAGLLTEELRRSVRLRIDWLDEEDTRPGRLGLTLLPGRRDWGRRLSEDLAILRAEGISRTLCLVPAEELDRYGVPDLMEACRAAGLIVHHLPVVDQKACSVAAMLPALRFVDEGLRAGERVLVHCVGGLGRSGMAAAAWLRARGLPPEEALAAVRRARSPRAVETAVQERFVREFPADALR